MPAKKHAPRPAKGSDILDGGAMQGDWPTVVKSSTRSNGAPPALLPNASPFAAGSALGTMAKAASPRVRNRFDAASILVESGVPLPPIDTQAGNGSGLLLARMKAGDVAWFRSATQAHTFLRYLKNHGRACAKRKGAGERAGQVGVWLEPPVATPAAPAAVKKKR